MAVDVKVPHLGESVTEGVIVRWLKEDGTRVERDEPLLELETEKAAMEINAEAAGTLHIVKPTGTRVRVGEVVARIAEEATTAQEPVTARVPGAGRAPEPGTSRAPIAAERRESASDRPREPAGNGGGPARRPRSPR